MIAEGRPKMSRRMLKFFGRLLGLEKQMVNHLEENKKARVFL